MDLKLKIVSGPYKGQELSLKPGYIIGRNVGEVRINDAKVSNRHAKIEKGPAGEFILVDLGSSNGLRVGGKKLAQVTLTPGLIVKIGNTDCEIIKVVAAAPLPQKDLDENTLPPIPIPTEKAPPEPVEKLKEWHEYLSEFSHRASEKVRDTPKELKPFDPLLILTVTRGALSGKAWVLGYGPRDIGDGGLDLHIFEPAAPPIAFTVRPKDGRAHFETPHPEKVRLNGRTTSAEVLQAGDEISVAETVITVSYKDDPGP